MTVAAPDDIMLLIFQQLVCAEDAWPAMKYDRRAAQAPFALAAVCQHWRGLALATSTLWTYFGFPPADKMHERHLQRLELLRHRVKTAPIDVVFGWHSQGGEKACRRDASRSVFDSILSLHLQWKTVVLHVAGCDIHGWKTEPLFHSLQWPLLEGLSLSMNGLSNQIPAAPLLRRLWFDVTPKMVDMPFINGGHPSLTMLSLCCDSVSTLRGLAPMLGDQLAELVLIDDTHNIFNELGPTATLGVFAALQYLTLDDTRWLQYMNTPSLKKLFLTGRCIEDVDSEMLSRFDHVQELQLGGTYFEANTLAMLADLSKITTLKFCCSRTLMAAFEGGRNYYRINKGTLRALAGLNPPIWPNLQRLHFALFDPRSNRGQTAVDAQDLVDFVSARNSRTVDPGHDGPTTTRIVEVVASYPRAPDWLGDILQSLLVDQVVI